MHTVDMDAREAVCTCMLVCYSLCLVQNDIGFYPMGGGDRGKLSPKLSSLVSPPKNMKYHQIKPLAFVFDQSELILLY